MPQGQFTDIFKGVLFQAVAAFIKKQQNAGALIFR
jgi:hypothetical protein